MSKKTPFFVMLCGLPGTGKSTWVDRELDLHPAFDRTVNIVLDMAPPGTYIVSTDDFLEMLGSAYDMKYNELFGDITYMALERMMYKIATRLFERGDNVIWDQTNLTVKSRKRKIDMVPESYYKVAVVFNSPPDHYERLSKRAAVQGKVIPPEVMDQMAARFVRPTKEEGFDDIIEVTM